MSKKNETDHFSEEIEELEVADNWNEVADINKNEKLYQIQLINGLLNFLHKIHPDHGDLALHKNIPLAPLPLGPNKPPQSAILNIAENFLKELERSGVINNLDIFVDYYVPNNEPLLQEEFVMAKVDFVPANLEIHLKKVLVELKNATRLKVEVKNKIIERKSDGTYTISGKEIDMPQNTLYYNCFDILMTETDQENKITFEKIVKELDARIREGKVESLSIRDTDLDFMKAKTRIQNALGQHQLFNFAKIKNVKLKNKLPNGKKIFEVWRGKGYKINNSLV